MAGALGIGGFSLLSCGFLRVLGLSCISLTMPPFWEEMEWQGIKSESTLNIEGFVQWMKIWGTRKFNLMKPPESNILCNNWVDCQTQFISSDSVFSVILHIEVDCTESWPALSCILLIADGSQPSFKYFQSAEEARHAIEAVLSADPRSVYRRKLCQDRLFYFTVDIAHITCWFGDGFAEVLRIKPASEPIQMTDPEESLVSLGS